MAWQRLEHWIHTLPESVLPLVLDTLLGPVDVSTGRVAGRTLPVAGGAHVGAHAVTIPVGPCTWKYHLLDLKIECKITA